MDLVASEKTILTSYKITRLRILKIACNGFLVGFAYIGIATWFHFSNVEYLVYALPSITWVFLGNRWVYRWEKWSRIGDHSKAVQ